ncbi:hypothetical protein [Actinocrispum wychmicini]|uniref:Excreted virulence factor EspC (Type VII ESX diderm) n=1 Tax=Actinocrispum wychmicini TaxID=1213861 RepID=A0A4R2JC39_9PSEU|nr:hypothetical protein [Actinocrispum wychmicini]TCO55977.1 hypothetical protein EV192_107402 [Actinocrispum wychmicini]
MQDHGEQLGVDLNELYRTAHYLAAVHTDFEQAVRDVDAAQPPGDSGPWTAMVPVWDALRSVIVSMLSGNAETIGDTSLTLRVIVQRYAETDQAAAARLTSLEQSDMNEQGW